MKLLIHGTPSQPLIRIEEETVVKNCIELTIEEAKLLREELGIAIKQAESDSAS